MNGDDKAHPILLTGASGYVGGRLLRVMRQAGYQVRCLARRPEFLRPRVDADVEIVEGDVLVPGTLVRACAGVHTAYYLIHALGEAENFRERERQGARHFRDAAAAAGLRRIVYLGGLGEDSDRLSEHLQSRHEVGAILRAGPARVIEFRAAIIIGSGSLSFELIRALTERLPVMVTPRWVDTPTQPIAVSDVLAYLLMAADMDLGEDHQIFEIGGADVVSYGDLMREYARQRGLQRLMVPVPVLTARLSSLWLALVTPVYARIGRKLIDGLRNPTVVRDSRARDVFHLRPRGVREAIALALRNEDQQMVETHWTDAISATGDEPHWGGQHYGNRLIDSRQATVRATPHQVYRAIRRLGGATGWYYGNPLWKLRGLIDVFVGGVGMRRPRRLPDHVTCGDTIDCWRVEVVEEDRLLVLRAEMRLPGRAWLAFEIVPVGEASELRQTAIFDPIGLPGLLYWYGMWPFHQFIFPGMLRGIVRTAEAGENGPA